MKNKGLDKLILNVIQQYLSGSTKSMKMRFILWLMVRTGFRFKPITLINRLYNNMANEQFRLNYRKVK